VSPGEVLAYLAGVVDGDGYLKVVKETTSSLTQQYRANVGVQQLWPGKAVRLFASTRGGTVTTPRVPPGRRPLARCELYSRKAEAAVRRLLPYLLLKKDQALLLLELARLKRAPRSEPSGRYRGFETIREAVLALHDGSWKDAASPLPLSPSLLGYERLSPRALGWTREQTCAYLAGVMDSDGSFRVERRLVEGMLGPHYRISIRCAQVAPSRAVDLFAETFGGRLTARKSARPNHRDLVSWSLHDRAAMRAIERLIPYLVVKQAEAYLLLDLRRLKAEGKKGLTEWVHANRWREFARMRKRCYTTGQVAEFERIHRAVQALHSGGPRPS